jgi:hypothetical protein
VRVTSRPTSRDTTIATYARPLICSSITTARANGRTGTMSLSPVLDSVVKLRNSSSIQVRSAVGSLAAMKLSGWIAWITV